MRHTRPVLAVLVLLGCAPPLAAQTLLSGRVVEHPSGRPVGGARVFLQDARGQEVARLSTDGEGRFRVQLVESGPVRIRAEHPDFRPTVAADLDLTGQVGLEVELRLYRAVVLLPPLEVVARADGERSRALAGFDERRRSGGGGWFLTREEIERRSPSRVSELLSAAPGVWVRPAGADRRPTVFMRRADCPAQIYIDGLPMHRSRHTRPAGGRGVPLADAFPIDDLVRPVAVEGIEVYQGLSKVPPDFLTPEAACGVVVIWTRRGG